MKKGFTLAEMIVALGVFSVAITIALAGFVNILDMQKRADAIRTAYDSLDFVMEIMSREIRTGTEYCISSSQGSCSPSFFHFTPASNSGENTAAYRINNNRIEIAVMPKLQSIQASDWIAFTPLEVKINNLKFKVTGNSLNDSIQPMVTIIIQAEATVKQGANVQLNLQTTVTQREIDS